MISAGALQWAFKAGLEDPFKLITWLQVNLNGEQYTIKTFLEHFLFIQISRILPRIAIIIGLNLQLKFMLI